MVNLAEGGDGGGGTPQPLLTNNETSRDTPSAADSKDIDLEGDIAAIRLSDAHKHYGSGKKKMPVLVGLDMEVQKGQIYGLLGE